MHWFNVLPQFSVNSIFLLLNSQQSSIFKPQLSSLNEWVLKNKELPNKIWYNQNGFESSIYSSKLLWSLCYSSLCQSSYSLIQLWLSSRKLHGSSIKASSSIKLVGIDWYSMVFDWWFIEYRASKTVMSHPDPNYNALTP